MKQTLILYLFMYLFTSMPAQKQASTMVNLTTDYLKKSRQQRTAAWLLMGGGVFVTGFGIVVGSGQLGGPETDIQTTAVGGTVLTLTGIGGIAGSIKLFNESGKNRRMANAALAFKMETASQINTRNFSKTQYPALSFQLRL